MPAQPSKRRTAAKRKTRRGSKLSSLTSTRERESRMQMRMELLALLETFAEHQGCQHPYVWALAAVCTLIGHCERLCQPPASWEPGSSSFV
jgi:hypothetical protein